MITDDQLLAIPDSSHNPFNASGQISWLRVFTFHFKVMPNTKSLNQINVPKAIEWIEQVYSDRISKRHTQEEYDNKKKPTYNQVVYVLTNGCLIHLDQTESNVEVLYTTTNVAQELINGMRHFRLPKRVKNFLHTVIQDPMVGLRLRPLPMNPCKCSVQKNYNDDMKSYSQEIIKYLRKKDASGLTLFYGAPGTGKSTYIRYLITQIKKEVIFLSPRLAGNMDDPQLSTLLIENPNTIVVIEDAEDLLISRDINHNSGISTLLNLSDGLLGASLGIQFICTFNTKLDNLDSALLRKGRLKTLYEFKPLTEIKSKELLQDLGVEDYIPTQPMTLAEIYHVHQHSFDYGRKMNQIGFVSQVA